jgi:uncharacterized protein YcaQ
MPRVEIRKQSEPNLSISLLRKIAIANSLFHPTSLEDAIERIGFVQADPIRAPAAAQDLILRHRVDGYIDGDLDRNYGALGLEEDFLFAYGYMTRKVHSHVYRRNHLELSELESKVLRHVRRNGPTHPRNLDAVFGRERVINDWGGYSQATKRALEALHDRGLLRVARRDNGVRVYEPAASHSRLQGSEKRLLNSILTVVDAFAPARLDTLRAIVHRLRRRVLGNETRRDQVERLIKSGKLVITCFDGVQYVSSQPTSNAEDSPRHVRLLAPFDPLVWDRKRFEHFWGWSYRFEAYTPKHKRVRGYYALPMLFGEQVIGWAEVVKEPKGVNVRLGFHKKRPRSTEFNRELELEIERLKVFLGR